MNEWYDRYEVYDDARVSNIYLVQQWLVRQKQENGQGDQHTQKNNGMHPGLLLAVINREGCYRLVFGLQYVVREIC